MNSAHQPPIRVIIVEDNRDLLENIMTALEDTGFATTGARSGLEFYRLLTETSYDIAIIDVGLPDQNGFLLAEYARKNTAMGIIMLTARGEMEDRLQGYGSGADSYMIKPVECRELAAVITNLATRLKSRTPTTQEPNRFNSWRLLSQSWRLVTPTGAEIPLTSREMQFMATLAAGQCSTVSRDSLLTALGYGADDYAGRAMDSLVRRIRRKIELKGIHPSPIKTVYCAGFNFSSPIVLC